MEEPQFQAILTSYTFQYDKGVSSIETEKASCLLVANSQTIECNDQSIRTVPMKIAAHVRSTCICSQVDVAIRESAFCEQKTTSTHLWGFSLSMQKHTV